MSMEALKNGILSDLPSEAATRDGEQRTMGFVRSLLEHSSGHLGPDQEAAVEALAHKVDVVKKVASCYDKNWKKPINGATLNDREMEALALMFLFAAGAYAGDGELGKRLKWLNSAFNAVGLVQAGGENGSRLATIRDAADSQLESLLSA